MFVTNITRLSCDVRDGMPKSENSVYYCRDVVGSVRWHPRGTLLARLLPLLLVWSIY